MKLWFLLAVGCVTVAVAGSLPSTAAGQSAGGDSVVGHVEFFAGSNEPPGRIDFDVHSGPSGENPLGRVGINTVGCIHVSGKTAVVGVDIGDQGAFFFSLADGPVDKWVVSREPGPLSANDCKTRFRSPSPDPSPYPIELVSDFVITDAQVPATYTECRQAGWVKYGYSSHAQWISSVHDFARNKCVFERAFVAIVPFREKY